MELRRHRSVMCQSHFSSSALSSQHFQPLLIAPLLAKSLEVQAHCLRNGKLAPHPCFSFKCGIRVYSRQSEEPKTGCQREPTAPLALSSSERRDPAHFARLRPLRRPSRPKQHRDFHQTERRLTSYRSGDIARARKKGGLKFLYRRTFKPSSIERAWDHFAAKCAD